MPLKCFFGKAFFTLFLFGKKKTCAKRKTMEIFLVKVFTEGKKVVGSIRILDLFGSIGIYRSLGFLER